MNITPLDNNSEIYQLLLRYVKNTHASTHTAYKLEVLDIFELEKETEVKKYRTDIDNKQLLWHGSRLTNFVGILSQGLRIAPPEAPVTGYMFGKGVYFADMVTKSSNYCFASR
jgi:poly [ADP-ribose] polymerase